MHAMTETIVAEGFDPRIQTFSLLRSDGETEVPISTEVPNYLYREALATQASFSAQFGATFIMLVIVLTMTPRHRYRRTPTIVNIAVLVANLARCVMFSLYFSSSWLDFYTFVAHDVTYVNRRDYNLSIATTAFNVPVWGLLQLALAIQAWSMVQLWPPVYKWGSVIASVSLVLTSLGFKAGSTALQIQIILQGANTIPYFWVRNVDTIIGMTSICWFCFLFIIRLIMHMWSHRTILPSAKGLSAMETLVMTNGVLMLIPVLFTGLQFGNFTEFEPSSLTFTSVALILPLGALIAQRLSSTAVFHSLQSHDDPNANNNNNLPLPNGWPPAGADRPGAFAPPSAVTSHIVSTSSRRKLDPVERELEHIDYSELEKGVYVQREIEHHEEHIARAS